jgi:hypothetical protein
MVSMNDMAAMVMEIGGKQLPIKHIPGATARLPACGSPH